MIRYTRILVLLLAAGLMTMSFSKAIKTTGFDVLKDKSSVRWTGYKPGGEHTGLVNIKSGSFETDGDLITSGSFVMDMKSIVCTDSESEKLLNHLKSEDFFHVDKYTESALVITGSKKSGKDTYDVEGNLTIRGVTQPISFKTKMTGKTENYRIYQADITIDRTKFGLVYKSSLLGDAMIYDNFDMAVKIVGKKME